MEALVHGGKGYGYGKRAQLTVAEDGVLIQRRSWHGMTDAASIRAKPLIPGEKLEGLIAGLSGSPEWGGHLCLRRGAFFTHILGLVNTHDGQPRVELDILATR
jgi:hypothetical protein